MDIDSSVTYSTSIVCRLDRNIITEDSFSVDVYLKSPQGERFGERIELPLERNDNIRIIRRRGSVVEVEWKYRDNISVGYSGVWDVDVEIVDTNDKKGVHGIGFSYNGER